MAQLEKNLKYKSKVQVHSELKSSYYVALSDKPYFEYFNPSWVIFKQAICKTTKISNMLSILVLAEYGSPFFSDQTLLTIARAEHLKARNPISFVLVVQRLPKFPLPMYKFWLKSKS